jgi:hypothetical protein
MFIPQEITVCEIIEKWSSLLEIDCQLIKLSRLNDERLKKESMGYSGWKCWTAGCSEVIKM